MLRKTTLLLVTLAVLVLSPFAANAASVIGTDPTLSNCYIYAPATVYEGQTFTSVVKCNTITSAVFGFEFGTTFTPALATVDGVAGTAVAALVGSAYTAGTFAPTNSVVGMNSLSNLYAVSHQGTDTSTGTFILGTFDTTVPFGIVADSTATVGLRDLKFSDRNGAALSAPVTQISATVSIVNLIFALRHAGTITVQSDGSMTNVRAIHLGLDGGNPTDVTTASGSSYGFSVGAYQYPQDKTSATVSISMTSHLSCTTNITLADGPNAASVLGTTYTLLAGDVNNDGSIGIGDATLVGSNYNTSQSGATDINGDGVVNIYDLVAIGRNYNATSATHPCS
jgi:hypothetical protein